MPLLVDCQRCCVEGVRQSLRARVCFLSPRFLKDSQLTKLNDNKSIQASSILLQVVNKAIEMHDFTD